MKKLQTVRSLSLMSSKKMGLFQLKEREFFSFSKMISKRTHPILLSIKNDTVRFFLKVPKIEKSVVYHQHSHNDARTYYSIVNNINNHFIHNMIIKDTSMKNRVTSFNTHLMNKHLIKPINNKLTHFINFYQELNRQELHREEKIQTSTFQFYKKNTNSLKKLTFDTSIALKNNFIEARNSNMIILWNPKNNSFSFKKNIKNINTNIQHSLLKYQTDKIFTNLQNSVNNHKKFLKMHQNINKSKVEIIYKKGKKDNTTHREENEQNHRTHQKELETLQINNSISNSNNSIKNNTIVKTQQEELIQIISHRVIKKIETIWSRENMRRGGDYGI